MSHLLIQIINDVATSIVQPLGNQLSSVAGARYRLAPPYLRELPQELGQHELEYRSNSYDLRTRAVLHTLWIAFRVSYYFGWHEGDRTTANLRHRWTWSDIKLDR